VCAAQRATGRVFGTSNGGGGCVLYLPVMLRPVKSVKTVLKPGMSLDSAATQANFVAKKQSV